MVSRGATSTNQNPPHQAPLGKAVPAAVPEEKPPGLCAGTRAKAGSKTSISRVIWPAGLCAV